MARNLPLKLVLAIGAAYVLARTAAFLGSDARAFRDTIDYNEVAAADIFSSKFLAGDHPPTVPFLYKLLGTGDTARLAGQIVASIASWLTLAGVAAWILRDTRVRVAAFAAVLCFSLAGEIVLWDALLMSESFSLSLTALLVAAWLWFAHRPGPWPLLAALAVTALWTLARDPHAYVLLVAAVALAATLLVREGRGLRALALAGVVAIALVSLQSASVGYKRWEYPLQNVIAKRIAADREALDHFADAGMPVTPEFVRLSRHYRSGDAVEDPFAHPAGMGNPELRSRYLPFQFWLVEEGRRTYTTYLLTHPGYMAKAVGDFDHVLLDPEVDWYHSDDSPAEIPVLRDVLYPPGPVLPLVYLAVALLLAWLATRGARPPPAWAVPAFMIVSSVPFALVAWHGEVLEIDRKGLIASVFLRLGALLLALMALDRLAASRSRSRPAPRAEAAAP
jgi:hypothetical protein